MRCRVPWSPRWMVDQLMFADGTHRSVSPAVTAARTRARLQEFGITRVADLTGLDRIGIPVMAAYRPAATSLVVSMGKGLTADAAYASATMESIELWHAERPSVTVLTGSARQLGLDHSVVAWGPLPRDHRMEFDEDTLTAWVTARSLVDHAETLVPYGVVHTDDDAIVRGDGGHFLCTSNGLASGNVAIEAQIHALCELIERDATTRWRLAGQPWATVLAESSVHDRACRHLLGRFAEAKLAVIVDDITSDLGVATMHATVFEPAGDPSSLIHATAGMGTHPSRAVALSRALTEAAQSRLALISGARDDLFRDRYAPRADGGSLHDALTERWRVASASTRSFADAPDAAGPTLEDELVWITDAIVGAGLVPWWVDLTDIGHDIAVGRAIVPGLEMLNDIAGFTPGPRALAAAARPPSMVATR